jgi:hypothetical protein
MICKGAPSLQDLILEAVARECTKTVGKGLKGPSVKAWCRAHGFSDATIRYQLRNPRAGLSRGIIQRLADALDVLEEQLQSITRSSEKRRSRDELRVQTRRERRSYGFKFKSTVIRCERCSTLMRRRSTSHRFCKRCGPAYQTERQKQRAQERREQAPLADPTRLPASAGFQSLEMFLRSCAEALACSLRVGRWNSSRSGEKPGENHATHHTVLRCQRAQHNRRGIGAVASKPLETQRGEQARSGRKD